MLQISPSASAEAFLESGSSEGMPSICEDSLVEAVWLHCKMKLARIGRRCLRSRLTELWRAEHQLAWSSQQRQPSLRKLPRSFPAKLQTRDRAAAQQSA